MSQATGNGRDALAARMAKLLGLPPSNVKLLMPLIPEEALERLASMPDDQFLTESTKLISAAQQRQFEEMSKPTDIPARPGPDAAAPPPAAPEASGPSAPEAAEGEPAAAKAASNVTSQGGAVAIPKLSSLDPLKKKQGGGKTIAGQPVAVVIGFGAGGLVLLGVLVVFLVTLFSGHPELDDLERGVLERPEPKPKPEPQPKPQPAPDPQTEPRPQTEPQTKPDPEPKPEPVTDPPSAVETGEGIPFPPDLLAQVGERMGAEMQAKVEAEWAAKTRAQKIAFLVSVGRWEGEVPDGIALPPKPKPPPEDTGGMPGKGQEEAVGGGDAARPTQAHAAQQIRADGMIVRAAAERNMMALTEALERFPASVNEINGEGQTAMHFAGRFGSMDMVELLLRSNAGVNVRDKAGKTPLHWLCSGLSPSAEFALRLIDRGANVNVGDSLGTTPLMVAAGFGNSALVEVFLKAGATPGEADLSGAQALHAASDREVAELLVNAGADVNAPNLRRQTPVHIAAGRGREAVLRFLVGLGGDVRAEDKFGLTPLYYAVKGGHTGTAGVLLGLGADPNAHIAKGRNGLLQVATRRQDQEMVELLTKHGAAHPEEP